MDDKLGSVMETQRCGIEYAFRRIGGKYKARIIWHLNAGTLRYGELTRVLPGVTTKVLTQALRELESDQLINREMFQVVPPKVEYSLTPKGRQLVPFLLDLNDWAQDQMRRGV